MTSARLEAAGAGARFQRLPDGRRLAFEWRSDGAGVAVVVLHGLPGSRLQRHPDAGIAERLGARLLSFDRPGFGASDWRAYRRLDELAQDLQVLADALGIQRFALAGISGGGPYACACAAALPERVAALGLISSVGPPGAMPGLLPFGVLRRLVRWPRLLAGVIETVSLLPRHRPGDYLRLLGGAMNARDAAILQHPPVRAMFTADLRCALAGGARGLARDLALQLAPWHIDWAAIRAPTRIWHGTDDRLVPAAAARALARAIPAARLRLYPGEGHFMLIERWETMLAELVRLTGATPEHCTDENSP